MKSFSCSVKSAESIEVLDENDIKYSVFLVILNDERFYLKTARQERINVSQKHIVGHYTCRRGLYHVESLMNLTRKFVIICRLQSSISSFLISI